MNAVQNYRVRSGDTVSAIAARNGISPEALMRANGMDPAKADGRVTQSARDPDRLQVGQKLLIPVATKGLEREHQVAPGETLLDIAERWGVTLKDLLAANPLLDAIKYLAELAQGPHGAPAAAAAPAAPGEQAATTAQRTATGTAIQQAAAPLAGHANAALDLKRFTDPALGSNAPAAIVIGSAEGTRRPDGSFTAAFGSHTDPGNAKNNRGSFSYQHAAASPADADRSQLQTLQNQLPAFERAARAAGLDPNNARLASAYLDLYNQSPEAAGRFLKQIGSLRGQPLDVAHLTELRFKSFVNEATNFRWERDNGSHAGGGFVTMARNRLGRTPTEAEVHGVIRADQLRRENALEAALSRQGLLAPAAAQPATAPATAGVPRHLAIARAEYGTNEIRGARDNDRVVQYHQATSLRAKDDETSWCSSFVNWTMKQAGIEGTHSAAARSWLKWGQAVDAAQVKPGDVIVFPRGNNPAFGHVAIVSEVLDNGRVKVIGGNQRVAGENYDGVTYAERKLSDAIGLRRAP